MTFYDYLNKLIRKDPERDVYASPPSRLLKHLDQLIKLGGSTVEVLKTRLRQSYAEDADTQWALMPHLYLATERYLLQEEIGQYTDVTRFRGDIKSRFPEVATTDTMAPIFAESAAQRNLLCRLFLHYVKEDFIATYDNGTQQPRATDEEVAAYIAQKDWAGLAIFADREMRRIIGPEATRALFERQYERMYHDYHGLPAFSSVVAILPRQYLDAQKIELLSKEEMSEVLTERVQRLENVNERLVVANRKLQVAQHELQTVQHVTRRNEQQLRGLLNTVKEGIITAAVDGKILLANAEVERMWGFAQGTLLNTHISEVIPESYLRNTVRGMYAGNTHIPGEHYGCVFTFEARRVDGSTFPVEVSITSFRYEGGSYYICALSDISQHIALQRALEQARRQLEGSVEKRTRELQQTQSALQKTVQRLQESNRELEQFAYAASHDLQEPLRTIGSYIQLVERSLGSELSDDAAEFMGYVTRGVERMQQLISSLLEYSRVGRQGFHFKQVQLADEVEAVQFVLGKSIADSSATVQFDNQSGVSHIVTDPRPLRQLLQNLISNAIKFRAEHPPEVQVRHRIVDSQHVIEVEDNGQGIPSDKHEEVFAVFKRLHRYDEVAGTGIGLSLCKKICHSLGGDIRVAASSETGTTFRIVLPLADASTDGSAIPLPQTGGPY